MMMKKSIETKTLKIKGNIMCWDDTMIQLSNVSCISTSPLEQNAFPKYSILMFIVAILLLGRNISVSIILIIGGIAWIYIYY